MINKFTTVLKRYFLSGVLVVVPIILTYIVISFLFESIDGQLQPLIFKLLGYYIPGLGFVITLLLILLAGVFTRNFIGAGIYRVGDRILARLPIIRPIYSAAKQLLEAITLPSMGSFKEVVLVEYPRKGVYAISLISRRMKLQVDGHERDYVVVFVPSTPTPISGMAIVVPVEEVIPLEMTVEEAVKFLVSGGVASNDTLRQKHGSALKKKEGVSGETG